MTDTTDRPEVDDPRVLALAKARQQLAYENPFNAVCPPWDGLSEQEQRLSLLDARSYLHAALQAGLVPAASAAVVPAADRTALRDRTAAKKAEPTFQAFAEALAAAEEAGPEDVLVDAVALLREAATLYDAREQPGSAALLRRLALGLTPGAVAVLPAPADRAAVLREAADRLAEEIQRGARFSHEDARHAGLCESVMLLRRWAAEAAAPVVGVAADTTPAETLAAAVASCPGYETSPNPCRCPCYGCKHHCAAHDPDAVPGPVVPAQPGNDTKTQEA